MYKTTLYYKIALNNIVDESENLTKEDIVDKLKEMLNDSRDYSSKTYRR